DFAAFWGAIAWGCALRVAETFRRGARVPGFPLPRRGLAIENERWRLCECYAADRPVRYACAFCREGVRSLHAMTAHCAVQPQCQRGPVIRESYPSNGLAVVFVSGEKMPPIARPDLRLRELVRAVAGFTRAVWRRQ